MEDVSATRSEAQLAFGKVQHQIPKGLIAVVVWSDFARSDGRVQFVFLYIDDQE